LPKEAATEVPVMGGQKEDKVNSINSTGQPGGGPVFSQYFNQYRIREKSQCYVLKRRGLNEKSITIFSGFSLNSRDR
jgi:hypothetical protein